MKALGNIIDIGTCFAPVDIDTANAWTGKRISMANAMSVAFVLFGAAGGAEDLVATIQQHTAYTGGTSSNLATATVATSKGITEWFLKAETALDNDEQWVRVTQSEGAAATIVGATYGAMQKVVVLQVEASQLGTGYTHLSVNGAITTATSQLAGGLYILSGLRNRRRPDRLGNLLNPNVANA